MPMDTIMGMGTKRENRMNRQEVFNFVNLQFLHDWSKNWDGGIKKAIEIFATRHGLTMPDLETSND